MTAKATPKLKQKQSVGRIKAGKGSAVTRRKVFAERYIVNGNNATEAAIFAGFSAHTANVIACGLMKEPAVIALIGNRTQAVLEEAQLTTARWAMEMACIGHFDPAELYDAKGNLIPIQQLPEHVRRAIGSVEVEAGKRGSKTSKIKFWDKNVALANIGKHLGLFERDNVQRVNAIQVNVQLLG